MSEATVLARALGGRTTHGRPTSLVFGMRSPSLVLLYVYLVYSPTSALRKSSQSAGKCAEKNIEVCKSLIDLANIELSKERRPCRDVRVCFDEVSLRFQPPSHGTSLLTVNTKWNVNDRENAPEKQKESRELDYRFYEVLSFVAWCNVFVRQSDACPIACLAQSVNVVSHPSCVAVLGNARSNMWRQLSPLRTKRDGLLLLPIYYP